MNFARKIFHSLSNAMAEPTAHTEVAPPAPEQLTNVVQLPQRNPLDEPGGLTSQSPLPEAPPAKSPGLLDQGAISTFMRTNHFGLGQHDGARFKTQQALGMGRQSLMARFQALLAQTVAQKQASIDGLQNMKLQIQGVCQTTTDQLELAIQRLQRDMEALHTQTDLTAQGKGWVLKALNEYQMGYAGGLRLAVDAELLAL